jgi:hypothetical protein
MLTTGEELALSLKAYLEHTANSTDERDINYLI